MFSAASASSLTERLEWGKYFSDRNAVVTAHPISASSLTERLEWGKYFSDRNAVGTIYIVDERAEGAKFIYNGDRAARRFTPASTFKIAHALFALDAGIIEDEFQVFPWDGIKRSVGLERYDAVWNSSQTLSSSMRYSVVWLYQQFARELGSEKEIDYMSRVDYGNASVGEDITQFWLDGSLEISALEQIAFLQKLYRNQLPFAVEHQRLVKDIMITEAGSDYKIRSKTGWGPPENKEGVGWYVGWVERDDGAIFFALNIDMPNDPEDLSKRTSIAREILYDIDALNRR
ncbi:class D beta-lactamase [Myxosarcina sp. GI1(2024)]